MPVFERVPVVDVHNENIKEVWPTLTLAVKTATFIGLDLELSGLGDRKRLTAKSIEDRYVAMSEVSKSMSVLSLGLSCFKLTNFTQVNASSSEPNTEETQNPHRKWTYVVQTFNITLLCDEDYVVEPLALRFLVDHGFDFNKQYSKGVPYNRGIDRSDSPSGQMIRDLFTMLLQAKPAIVFHNALVDLVFLYQSFYANLPSTSASFLADLEEMFPSGIFDSKFIADYEDRLPASYLEYVFNKCYREHDKDFGTKSAISINFPCYPESYPHVNYCQCKMFSHNREGQQFSTNDLLEAVCEVYAAHGWCKDSKRCPKSHDIGLILDLDASHISKSTRRRKRKRNQESNTSSAENIDDCEEKNETAVPNGNTVADLVKLAEQRDLDSNENTKLSRSGSHRAGFDAFMTGFILASYVAKYGSTSTDGKLSFDSLGLDKFKNKVYLVGKDIPWTIAKSSFANTSKGHREKHQSVIDRMSGYSK